MGGDDSRGRKTKPEFHHRGHGGHREEGREKGLITGQGRSGEPGTDRQRTSIFLLDFRDEVSSFALRKRKG